MKLTNLKSTVLLGGVIALFGINLLQSCQEASKDSENMEQIQPAPVEAPAAPATPADDDDSLKSKFQAEPKPVNSTTSSR